MHVLHNTVWLVAFGLCIPAWAQTTASPTLSLESAITQAVQSSPALSSAHAAFFAAQGSTRQAGALSNPEVTFDAENLAGSGDFKGTNAAEYTYGISQKIELGGKRTSRRAQALAEQNAIGKDVQATRLDVIRDVTIAYGDILALQQKSALAKKQEELAKDILTNVTQRVGAARDPLIYKSQAEVSFATAALERKKTERELQLAKRKLAAMWGGSILEFGLDDTVLTSVTAPQPLDTYQAKLPFTPDLQRFEDLQASRQTAFQLEKKQNIPDPSFSVGVRDFRESGHQAMVAGISLPIPVFNRNSGNIARASSEIAKTEHDAKQAKLNAEKALHEAWLEWQSAHAEATELQTRILPSAEKALTLSRQGYERGRFSFLEVLNAQRTLAEAQEQHVNAQQRQLNAKAIVERLTTPTLQETTK